MTISKVYTNALAKAFNNEIDFDSNTVKVMLCTSSYTPNQGTHAYKSSITNEVTATGYTAGGATLGSKAVTVSGTKVKIDADDIVWSSSSISARYAVFYVDTGTAATSPLIAYWDFEGTITSTNNNFSLTLNAAGIIEIETNPS